MKKNVGKTPQLLLENQLCFPLYSASNAVVRAYRPLLNKLDLTYLQYIVLMVLWQETSMNVTELGHRLRLDSGTLTPLLKRLESKGLVDRTRCSQDERVRIITITKQGEKLKKLAVDIPGILACASQLSRGQQLELKKLCEHVLDSIDN